MKAIVLYLILAIAATVSSADEFDDQNQELPKGEQQLDQDQPLKSLRPRCPTDNSKVVYIPDANCNRFWQCSNGVAIRMSCPAGLHWNRRLNVCDWPRRARCIGRRFDDADQLSDHDEQIIVNQFQLQVEQDPISLVPKGELTLEDQDKPLESLRRRCPRDNSKEVYWPDRNCNMFWQCSNGIAIRLSCPKGLQWNRRLNVCDWPTRARCINRRFDDADKLDAQDQETLLDQFQLPEELEEASLVAREELTAVEQDQPLQSLRRCPRDNSREVYLPDRNCNKFWQCSNGVPIKMSCPEGLHWNRRLNVCDWPSRARCARRV
ncbi:probable chitinase 10 [Anthonomus grandis grandis]|uniref:probable chitinase 10 n=1 Tax=Anthonomus grandis grandis TaxID=2921223 RepID=UPI0021652C1E|nr:probable chitinase 10 [Anthonomus grandis grandis]